MANEGLRIAWILPASQVRREVDAVKRGGGAVES